MGTHARAERHLTADSGLAARSPSKTERKLGRLQTRQLTRHQTAIKTN